MTANPAPDAQAGTVEAVAEAIHEVWRGPTPWYAEADYLKEWFRKIAHAALAAAGLTTEADQPRDELRAAIEALAAKWRLASQSPQQVGRWYAEQLRALLADQPPTPDERDCSCGHDEHQHDREASPALCMVCGDREGCDLFGCACKVICSMGPTCPGAILARLDGAGCHRVNPPTPDEGGAS